MIKKPLLVLSLVMVSCFTITNVKTQQIADKAFKPPIESPAYPLGKGPILLMDEGHFNLHTAGGRYEPFADLLRRDSYVIKTSASQFSSEALKRAQILVIPTALAERNRTQSEDDWSLPTPSAFSDQEIAVVRKWVEEGGALLLLADHMPFSGGAGKLAEAFGAKFSNGFARDPKDPGAPIIFQRSDGSLKDHVITRRRTPAEKINAVATFTGSAFQVERNASPLLVFGPDVVSWLPKVAFQFKFDTPRIPGGWYQGATITIGKGRVAIFGDATLFTAQLRGPGREPLGMNEPVAPQNAQFLLNVLHWLSGLLGE
jgi:hypothetical protein